MIYTVTLNTGLDYFAMTDTREFEKTNRTHDVYVVPGGKGLNVSVVLSRLGDPSTAFSFVSGFTGHEVERLMNEENVACDFIDVGRGFTRINVKLVAEETTAAPSGLGDVISTLLSNIIANPVSSVANANYLGILFWAVVVGLALKKFAAPTTQTVLQNLSDAITEIVRWIINLAPFGICGLVFNTVCTNGLGIFTTYGKVLALLVGCMLFESLIVNGIIAWIHLKRNPYPLIFKCMKESGLTAFFTRSSAANIPINMALCAKLGLDPELYSVSIPLGATINMDGAAITIAVLTLACAHTLGIPVDFGTAIVLSVVATLAACGASGVTGGSLLLIPMACSLFGISNDIAMQVVSVGFIIGAVQDSVETMLNSSGDVIFAAIAEYRDWLKAGRRLPGFMYTEAERKKMGIDKDFKGDTKASLEKK